MLTLFTSPKSFINDQITIIQKNAIRSWLSLYPTPEIILLGKEEGVSEIASEFGVNHIPDIKCNKYGTPRLDSLFSTAESNASNHILCYINTDIILIQDFMDAIIEVTNWKDYFLIIGRRWDLIISKLIDFNSPSCRNKLLLKLKEEGRIHPESGIDFFVFPNGALNPIAPFALGRGFWDNWLIWRARSRNIPVVDITPRNIIIHQNHDYFHVSGGLKGKFEGPERKWNRKLAGRWLFRYDLRNSSHELTQEGIKSLHLHPILEPVSRVTKLFLREGIGELLGYTPLLKRVLKSIIKKRKISKFFE